MMRRLFPSQANTFFTAEKRMLHFAAAAESGDDMPKDKVPPLMRLSNFIEANTDMHDALKKLVDKRLSSATDDAVTIENFKKEFFEELNEGDKFNKEIGVVKDIVAIRKAFPTTKDALLKFAYDTNIVSVEVAEKVEAAREALLKSRPGHLQPYSENFTKVTYLPDGVSEDSFLELVARFDEAQAALRRVGGKRTGKPGSAYFVQVVAERQEANDAVKKIQGEMQELLGDRWQVYLAEYRKYKKNQADSIRHDKERINGMPPARRRNLMQELDDDEEIVGGLRRKKAPPAWNITPAQREAKQMRKGDYVDEGGSVSEVLHNPNLRVRSFDSKTGTYRDRTAERNEFMKGKEMDYSRNPNGELLGSRGFSSGSTSRPGLFSPGTVSSEGHDRMVRDSTSHVDMNVQKKSLTKDNLRLRGEVEEAIKTFETRFPDAEKRRQAKSFKKIEDHLKKDKDATIGLERGNNYRKILGYIDIVNRELALADTLDAIADRMPVVDTQAVAVGESLRFTINIKNELTGKTYKIHPQNVLNTDAKAQDAQAVRDVSTEGLFVRFERMGKEIPDSYQRYVSSATFGVDDLKNKYFTISTSAGDEVTLGNSELKPREYDVADTGEEAEEMEEDANTHSVSLDFSEGFPEGLSIINSSRKNNNAVTYYPNQLESLDSGAVLKNANVGVTIRKVGDEYRMSLDNDSRFRIMQRSGGSSADYKNISSSIPGLNPDTKPLPKAASTPSAPEKSAPSAPATVLPKSAPETKAPAEKKIVAPEAPLPPTASREPETVRTGLTQEEFDSRKEQVLVGIGALLAKMKEYKGAAWEAYIGKVSNDMHMRFRNFDPADPLLNNGRRMNEWNIEQLEKTYEAYKTQAEASMTLHDSKSAAATVVPEKSVPPAEEKKPEATSSRPTPAPTRAAELDALTESLPTPPSAAAKPESAAGESTATKAAAIDSITATIPAPPTSAPAETTSATAKKAAAAIDDIAATIPTPPAVAKTPKEIAAEIDSLGATITTAPAPKKESEAPSEPESLQKAFEKTVKEHEKVLTTIKITLPAEYKAALEIKEKCENLMKVAKTEKEKEEILAILKEDLEHLKLVSE